MEYWEFLLQKEGDQSWLPLESSQVEILEGRYRVMAHTSRIGAPVEVQISQLLRDQMPPRRRNLHRRGQTNDDGLMVVIPFTRLGPGLWTIHCVGEVLAQPMADPAEVETSGSLGPEPWSYAVQLQVQALDAGEDGDWFADEGMMPVDLDEDSRLAGGSDTATPAWPSLDLDQVTAAMNRVQARLATAPKTEGFSYHIALSQTALVGSQGQSLELTGQVTGIVEGESCADMALVVRLSDPQTAEVVALCPFALAATALPAGFTLALTVPPELNTRLLLGDIGLVSSPAGTVSVLALQGFTVTVDLASLFDAIANRGEAETSLGVVFPADGPEDETEAETETSAATAAAWANVTLPQSPARVMPTLTLPRSGLDLPPKIYYPSPHEAASRRPVLPPLGSSESRSTAQVSDGSEAVAAVNLPPDLSIDLPTKRLPEPPSLDLGDEPLDELLSHTTLPTASPRVPAPSLSLPPLAPAPKPAPQPEPELVNLDPDPGPDSLDSSTEPEPEPDSIDPALLLDPFLAPTLASKRPTATKAKVPLLPSHEVMAFRELKLQDRFWTRLNDLAVEIQQATLVKQAEREAALQVPYIDEDDEEAEIPAAFVPFAGEVVIYEDEDDTLGAKLGQMSLATLIEQPAQDAEIVTPPVPILEMPEGELVAGDPLLLSLRVPFHPNRLYLKVWIADLQTRSLADEPRQIMHLSPNGRGELEGSIQLTVPLGCLEAWFEAISIDMLTQQESYKTSVCRRIVPAGVESSALDEFEL